MPVFSSLLQAAVVSAQAALCEEFYQAEPGQADLQMQGKWNFSPRFNWCVWNVTCVSLSTHTHSHTHVDVLISHYINELKSHQMATCFGAALTLGCLPRFMISGKLTQVW